MIDSKELLSRTATTSNRWVRVFVWCLIASLLINNHGCHLGDHDQDTELNLVEWIWNAR